MRILISRDFVACVSKLYLGLQFCAFDSVEEILMAKAAMRVQQKMRLRGQRLTATCRCCQHPQLVSTLL